MWAKFLRLKLRRKKNQIGWGGELIFLGGEKTLERESSNFSLRATEIDWSEFVRPRTKVHLLDEAMHGYRKYEISSKI